MVICDLTALWAVISNKTKCRKHPSHKYFLGLFCLTEWKFLNAIDFFNNACVEILEKLWLYKLFYVGYLLLVVNGYI